MPWLGSEDGPKTASYVKYTKRVEVVGLAMDFVGMADFDRAENPL